MNGGDAMEDELYQPPAPTAVAVARRALVLCGVVCLANIDGSDDGYCRDTAARVNEWFDELGLWPYAEKEERELLSARYGRVSEKFRIRSSWYAEGLAILAWALRRHEFPPHAAKADAIAVTDSLLFLDCKATKLIDRARIRSAGQIEACREWFYDLHVTLRQFLFHGGTGRLAAWIGRYTGRLGLKSGVVRSERVLLYQQRPLAESPRQQLIEWEWVVRERHRAAMWLAGTDEAYTEISVDT